MSLRSLRQRALLLALPLTGLAAIGALAGACGSLSTASPGEDAGAPGSDGASGADVTAASDAASPDSGAAAHDGSAPDASTPDADAGSSDGATLGISWPVGRSFPGFPAVQSLDVADLTAGPDASASAESQYLYTSLQGLINRTQPRIYLRDSAGDHEDALGGAFWLDKIAVPKNVVADPLTLFTKYRAEISGVVIYDPALIDTVNLATTIAGIEGGVVASPALAATLTSAPYKLPTLADLRTNAFASPQAVYQYELANYRAKATDRLIIGLDPTKTDSLRDYAIATKALVVWLDPTNPGDLGILNQYLAGLQPNAPYLGWWTQEQTGVGAASTYGVPTYAADWSRNLTVFSGVPRVVAPPARPAPPALENKAYVSIFMSDGDNLQEDQHLIPLKWADPARGKVPISWTVQPGLVDVAPMMLQYFYDTATANDVLVSGPSGLGYTYPQNWPVALFPQYAIRSADYLTRAGLGVITVWNNGVLLSQSTSQANDYAANMPHLLGVTDQLGGGGLSTLNSTLPLLVFASGYAGNELDLENAINGQLTGWNGSAPLFIAVQGDMNQSVINPTTFLAVQTHFASRSDVVFVRGDHLFQLIRMQSGLPTNP